MKLDQRTLSEKISDNVTHFAGSWKFIISFSLILLSWILFNVHFQQLAFDKYPFILLNLILSFIAAFQAPFIMMTQYRAEKKQDEAYRAIFYEIKELVEIDIANEQEIKSLEDDIKRDLSKLIAQHKQLLVALQQNKQEIIDLLNEDEI